jgi:hypothetical protein
MAILKANPDGTSNAQPGDFVVTGGGVFQKTSNGSIPVTNAAGENILKDLVGVTKTGSNAVVDAAYTLLNNIAAKSGTNTAPKAQSPIDQVLNDTQVFDSVTNYDSFTTPGSGSSALYTGQKINFSNIMGYIIVGLVLLVVLDKLIGGGK